MALVSGETTETTSSRPYRAVRKKTKPIKPDRPKKSRKRSFSEYCADSNSPTEDNETKSDSGDERQLTAWIKNPLKDAHSNKHTKARPLSVYEQEEEDDDDDDTFARLPPLALNASATIARRSDQRLEPGSGDAKQEQNATGPPELDEDADVVSQIMSSDDEDDDLIQNSTIEVKPNVQTIAKATPKRPSTMKKVLIDASAADDDELLDSPSKRASTRLSNRKAGAEESTRRQLFSHDKRSRKNSSPIRDLMDNASTVAESRESSPLPQAHKALLSPVKPKALVKISTKKMSTNIPTLNVALDHVQTLKYEVLSKLTLKKKLPLQYRDTQSTDVHTLLRETIVRAESNSALLVGPKSTGKSLLVETVLQSFKDAGHEFLVVRLNGKIQTDDRMALKAIAKQLQPDQEEIANVDIMTALLAILSHPRDFGENEDPLSTVILLDHFEQFTEHSRQTLLYNLFDIAQSKKAPICVLGLTSRVNSYDALEKRVKSRFSHRVIQFPNLDEAQFSVLAKSALLCDPSSAEDKDLQNYKRTWNDYISTSEHLATFITFTYLTSINVLNFFATLVPRIALLGTSDLYFAFPDFSTLLPLQSAGPHLQPDAKVSILPNLSLLELGMLISAARLEIKAGRINLMTTMDEHTALVQKSAIAQRSTGVTTLRSASRAMCTIAWQKLMDTGLLMPQTGRLGSGSAEFRVVKVEVRLEEIAALVKAEKVRIGHWMNSWLTLG